MLLQSNLAVTLRGPPTNLLCWSQLQIYVSLQQSVPSFLLRGRTSSIAGMRRNASSRCMVGVFPSISLLCSPGVGGWVVIVLQVPQPARGAQRKIWVCLRATHLLARCFFPPYVTLIWSEICSGFILLAWDSGSCL